MNNRIKLARVAMGLTQQQLAQKTEVSRQTINAVEAGKYVPSTVLALKLSAILETSINELFALEDSDWKK
jgi:putative transcriptional regulator